MHIFFNAIQFITEVHEKLYGWYSQHIYYNLHICYIYYILSKKIAYFSSWKHLFQEPIPEEKHGPGKILKKS